MAQLLHEPYPVSGLENFISDGQYTAAELNNYFADQDATYDLLRKQSDALPEGTLCAPLIDAGFLARFSVADGYALYRVIGVRPLVLQHVPLYDAWQIPPAHLRGLTVQDLLQLQRGEIALRSLFGGE